MKRKRVIYYLLIVILAINISFINRQKSSESDSDGRLKIWVGFTAARNFYREILLTVDERATDSMDKGFEAVLSDEFPNDIYWVLNKNKLIIQAIGFLSKDRVVPIGIKSKGDGPLLINVDTIQNPYQDIEVYIRDNSTMETYDILNESFEISLGEGQFNDRYSLVFKPKAEIEEEPVHEEDQEAVTEDVDEEVIHEPHIFIGEYNELLRIKMPEEMEISNISLFNMVGQKMQFWNKNLNASQIDLPIHVDVGVYVVLLETNKGRVLKKVIIK
jgi:hypothetical protein